MPAEDGSRVERLAEAARRRPPPERVAYLEGLSELEPGLRTEVERLLESDLGDEPSRELTSTGPTRIRAPRDKAHEGGSGETRVGPYRLLEEIGRGGMGTVHLGVRDDDEYKKRVAVKLLKKGMDSDEIVRRFRNERQILAAVEHANIAKLYDGGTTEQGNPYFVMELVQGQPLDQYCDTRRLTLPERLKLFRKVCAAVQFAHQNLVVHRDLKPGNILVGPDGEPKLLDFGIAKLLNPELAAATVDPTRFQSHLMTPAYASPEQVRGEPVTTAADVYSLGMILYELLTGRRPYQVTTRSIPELTRIVCEVEPTRPSQVIRRPGESTRTDGTSKTLDPGAISRARGDSADKLRKRLTGDLDNIVMMALRKEPQRRYSSVEQFSEDLHRHLEGRPVRARKSTPTYRLSKFVQRHRVGVAATVLVVVSFVGFTAMTIQARARAEREALKAEREAAKAQTINEFMRKTLAAASPNWGAGREVTVVEALGRAVRELESSFSSEPEVQAAIQQTVGRTYRELGRFEEAEQQLVSALEARQSLLGEDHPDAAESLTDLAHLREDQGAPVEAARLHREALRRYRALPGHEAEIALNLDGLASSFTDRGDYDESERLQREALRVHQELGGAPTREYSDVMNNLAISLDHKGEYEEAEALYRRALAIDRELLGDEHPSVATTVGNLGLMLLEARGAEAAEPLVRESLDIRRKVLGDHPGTAHSLASLGQILGRLGDYERGIELLREALEMQRRYLGDNHRAIGSALQALAWQLRWSGRLDEAETHFRKAIAILRNQGLEPHPGLAAALSGLARLLAETGEAAEAEELFQEACALDDATYGPRHWASAYCRVHLGALLSSLARYEEAEALLLGAYPAVVEVLGEDHERSKKAREHLTTLYERWGKPDEATKYRDADPGQER